MTKQAQELLALARKLPESERAELAAQIMATFDGDAEEDATEVEAAWAAEIERRLEGYLSGKDKAVPWEAARAEALRRLKKE